MPRAAPTCGPTRKRRGRRGPASGMLGLVVFGREPDRDLAHGKLGVVELRFYLVHDARTELDFSVSGDGRSDPYVHASKSTSLRVAVQNW